MRREGIQAIIRPRSIAVIGASRDPSKIGFRILHNVLSSGFRGPVYAVNPNADEVLGLKCYRSVVDVPGFVDLAVVAVPARLVPQVLVECGLKKVSAVAVISSGFKEVGNVELEEQVVEIARKYGFRILGPNIVGVWDTVAPVNYSFIDANPLPGSIAFVSQSGALITSLLWWTRERGLGFSSLVSIGNRADVGETDLLTFLREDPNTRVVAFYMEGLGEGEGKVFLDEAYETSLVKPVIVLKAGKSPEAAEAIKSHTGSLAGSNEVYESAFKQARVLRASSLRELFNWALALSLSPPPREGGAVVLTHGGGAGVIAVDLLSERNVPLAVLPVDLQEKLRKHMPPFGSTRNPVDLTGMMTAANLECALKELMREERIGSVLVWVGQGAIPKPEELGEAVISAVEEVGLTKPLIVSITGGEECREVLQKLIRAGVPSYESPEDAAESLAAVYRYYRMRRTRGSVIVFKGENERAKTLIEKAIVSKCSLLAPMEAFEVVKAYGVPVVESAFAQNVDEASEAAARIGYPVALAVETPDVAHKTEVGGIALNIGSEVELRRVFDLLLREFANKAPQARVLGVSVRKMMPKGVEVFIGAKRDPVFGSVIGFGWGGVVVELVKDTSFRVLPLRTEDVEEMIDETKIGRMLRGFRGQPLDLEIVKKAVVGVSALMEDFNEVEAVDVNPLFVYEKGAVAVDVKVYLRTNIRC
ncbi:MAG: acetate--CoA ligase family protein [Thermofilaceae archaeon]|nr:acetate--CoA ligase family protein [Thermofilaceae archaeon]